MNKNNIIKKILCCFGVVFALVFSFFTFKNTNQLLISKADTTITSFLGSEFNVETKVYQNDSVVNSDYAFLNLKFNFNNINGNTLNIDFSGISQLYSESGSINTYSRTTSNIDKFLSLTQVPSQPHDNILVAGTYTFVDSLGPFSGKTLLANIPFSNNNQNFQGLRYIKQFNDYMLQFISDSYVTVYQAVGGGWQSDSYKTIILSTDQQVDSDFYNWAITQGNLVYKGGSTITVSTLVDTLSIPLANDKTNIITNNILLDDTTMKYTFLRVTAKNLVNLDFLGVTLKYDTSDISQTYYSLQYFNSSGSTLTLDFAVLNDGLLPEKTYYFTSTNKDNYNLGYQDGYNQGNIDGKQLGLSEGYDNGLNTGYNNGYNIGYSKGVESAHNYTFMSLISSVISVPFTAFKSIFNFDLLGVNIYTLLGSLFTISVILTIIKKVI